MIDNYDSFTYNLVQDIQASWERRLRFFATTGSTWRVWRHPGPDRLVAMAGPFSPQSSGGHQGGHAPFCGKLPILGVCLGHEGPIGAVFGGRVVRRRG